MKKAQKKRNQIVFTIIGAFIVMFVEYIDKTLWRMTVHFGCFWQLQLFAKHLQTSGLKYLVTFRDVSHVKDVSTYVAVYIIM